jgi:hypothetical protein
MIKPFIQNSCELYFEWCPDFIKNSDPKDIIDSINSD